MTWQCENKQTKSFRLLIWHASQEMPKQKLSHSKLCKLKQVPEDREVMFIFEAEHFDLLTPVTPCNEEVFHMYKPIFMWKFNSTECDGIYGNLMVQS